MEKATAPPVFYLSPPAIPISVDNNNIKLLLK